MTIMTMCALCPPMCRMAEDPEICRAVAALAGGETSPTALEPLRAAMLRYPEDASAALSLLGSCTTAAADFSQCFDQEALALFHLCGQCSAGEMLSVLTRCTAAPTAEGLALLIGEHRRMQAMARYGLQLLWRMCGDEALPDALTVFPEDGPRRSVGGIITGLIHQLTGGDPHD